MVPAEMRAHDGSEEGVPLIFRESPRGLALPSREALLARIQTELEGINLVEELVIERRRQAASEDAA